MDKINEHRFQELIKEIESKAIEKTINVIIKEIDVFFNREISVSSHTIINEVINKEKYPNYNHLDKYFKVMRNGLKDKILAEFERYTQNR